MSINITESNFTGRTTQIGYTNVIGSQIEELREAVSREHDVNASERAEVAALLTELKQKLEGGATKSEVASLWKRIEEILSSAAKLAPFLTQVGKLLGL